MRRSCSPPAPTLTQAGTFLERSLPYILLIGHERSRKVPACVRVGAGGEHDLRIDLPHYLWSFLSREREGLYCFDNWFDRGWIAQGGYDLPKTRTFDSRGY